MTVSGRPAEVAFRAPAGAWAAPAPPHPAAEFDSRWDARARILATRLSGRPRRDDIDRWEAGLRDTLAEARDGSLGLLVDLTGYEAADVPWEVHARQREVIPRLLAELGHRPAYRRRRPDGRVRAVAHVHHDRDKVALYETALAGAHEHFFDSIAAALAWLGRAD